LYTVGNKKAIRLVQETKKKYGNATGVYNSYVMGFLSGLRKKLESQSRSLMVVIPEDVSLAYEEVSKSFVENKKLRSLKEEYFDADSYQKGVFDGKYMSDQDGLNDVYID
jgi:hypothetical protein